MDIESLLKVLFPAVTILWQVFKVVRGRFGSARGKLGSTFWVSSLLFILFTAARFAVYESTTIADPFEVMRTPATKENLDKVSEIARTRFTSLDFTQALTYVEKGTFENLWARVGSATVRCPYNDGTPLYEIPMTFPPIFLRFSTYLLQILCYSELCDTARTLQGKFVLFALMQFVFDIAFSLVPAHFFFYRNRGLRIGEVIFTMSCVSWVFFERRYFAPNRQTPARAIRRMRQQLEGQNVLNAASRDIGDAISQSEELSRHRQVNATKREFAERKLPIRLQATVAGSYALALPN